MRASRILLASVMLASAQGCTLGAFSYAGDASGPYDADAAAQDSVTPDDVDDAADGADAMDAPESIDAIDVTEIADAQDADADADAGPCAMPCPAAGSPTQPSCPDPCERGCGMVPVAASAAFSLGLNGAPATEYASPSQPSIDVSAYYLDRSFVTVARFRRFWFDPSRTNPTSVPYPGGQAIQWGSSWSVIEPTVQDATHPGANWIRAATGDDRDYLPLNAVGWQTALAFCVWDGGRLPTAAEYEYVARWEPRGALAIGSDGRTNPWDGLSSSPCLYGMLSGCNPMSTANTRPAGCSLPTEGFWDLSGNVHEWVADAYQDFCAPSSCPAAPNGYWDMAPKTDPLCTWNADTAYPNHESRGGSYTDPSFPTYDRSAFSNNQNLTFGFRCARTM